MENITFFIENHYFNEINIFFANSMLRYERGTLNESSLINHEKMISSLNASERILYLTYLLASFHHEQGDLSFDLAKWAGKSLFCKEQSLLLPNKDKWLTVIPSQTIGLIETIGGENSNGQQIADIPYKPLLLFKNKIYLQKNFIYQQVISNNILQRKNPDFSFVDDMRLKKIKRYLFPHDLPTTVNNDTHDNENIDWQHYAAFLALAYPLMILSGGPGTGKTTTVFKILILLIQNSFQLKKKKKLKVQLVAPTGKAVKRLQESLQTCSHDFKNELRKINQISAIPIEHYLNDAFQGIMTVHRFLSGTLSKSLPESRGSYPHIDVLIIDESTMIPLEILAYLFNVLSHDCRIIFLGDKEQLSSIGEKSLLNYLLVADTEREVAEKSFDFNYPRKIYGDFWLATTSTNLKFSDKIPKFKDVTDFIGQRTVILQKNYRLLTNKNNKNTSCQKNILSELCQKIISHPSTHFENSVQKNVSAKEQSMIDFLDENILLLSDLENQPERSTLLRKSDFFWQKKVSIENILTTIKLFFLPFYREYFTLVKQYQHLSPTQKIAQQQKIFSLLNKIIVLTIANHGKLGVQSLNRHLEEFFLKEGWIDFSDDQHYPGRVILLTENNHRYNLYNGDCGIVLPHENGEMQFCFQKNTLQISATHEPQTTQPQLATNQYQMYSPYELSKWQVGFAITVHKSQGSEYENVVFALPPETAAWVDRSLIYTALTRTKKRCFAFFSQDDFLTAIKRINHPPKTNEFYDYLKECINN